MDYPHCIGDPADLLHRVRVALNTPEGHSVVEWATAINEYMQDLAEDCRRVDDQFLDQWRKR